MPKGFISPEAIKKAQNSVKNARVSIRTQIADLESGDFTIEENAYGVIICFNYLYRPLIPQIKGGLKKGGIIVYETYIADQAQFGKPSNPDFLLARNELLDMFRDFRCLRYHEGFFENRGAVAGIIAEK